MSGQQQLDANTALNTVNVASRVFFPVPALTHGDLFGLCRADIARARSHLAEWEIKLQVLQKCSEYIFMKTSSFLRLLQHPYDRAPLTSI